MVHIIMALLHINLYIQRVLCNIYSKAVDHIFMNYIRQKIVK